MKAVVFTEFGSSDKLHVADIPVPSPSANEVLVRVQAATIDNVDILIRKGIYKTRLQRPAITGRDLVGVVEKVGSDVNDFSPGQAVWTNSAGFDGRMGATAEFVAVEAARLYPLPQSADPCKVVASVHAACTAQMIVGEVMKLREGSCILIEGAAGNVGRKLVQCAHAVGAKVVATSSEKAFETLRALGADRCFSYDEAGMQELSSDAHQLSIDHVLDTSGKVRLSKILSLLALGGQLTIITPPPKDTAFDAPQFYMRDLHIRGFVLSYATCGQLAAAARQLNRYYERGLLLEDPVEFHSFEDVPRLQARMENHGAHGMKYVIRP